MTGERYVLVVDDDPSIREFLELALMGEGYQVSSAANGEIALGLVQLSPPDLILLDMRMPVVDGWEFARRYHQSPAPWAPILVITAAVDAARRAAEIDADGYLAKPFDLGELLRTVDRLAR